MNSCVLLVRRRTRIRYRAPESDRSLPIRPSVMRTQSPERIDRRLLCTWTALTGPSAVSSPEDRSRILPIEERDVRHRDVLRAHGLTLVLVRAGPEVLLLHLLNHGEDTLLALRYPLRKEDEVRDLRAGVGTSSAAMAPWSSRSLAAARSGSSPCAPWQRGGVSSPPCRCV